MLSFTTESVPEHEAVIGAEITTSELHIVVFCCPSLPLTVKFAVMTPKVA
jgi:hypothetical protein